tara:strand:+ start:5691 stop:6434 length:744 start_codon:yes stop_codon:yes gene_type:complete
MTSISICELSVHFGGLAAINKISLEIKSGDRHAIIGPNGAGKTTLLKAINGQLSDTKGAVFLGRQEITNLPIQSRTKLGIGCTFQHNNLFSELTVIENIYIALQNRLGIANHLFRKQPISNSMISESHRLLDTFGLSMVKSQVTDTLSYGQQRVLDLAIAIAMKPKALLLDEPTAGMSVLETTNMIRIIEKLPDAVTLILVEHDMNVVFEIAKHITVLHNGKIIGQGTPSKIRNNSVVQEHYLGKNT